MRLKTLQRAKDEAIRFLEFSDAAEKNVEWKAYMTGKGKEASNNFRHTAAAKRASMDLTRVLADLRQGR